MGRDKVILAYSGGLDTSVMVPWIGEKYGLDVVAFTVDLGQGEDIERVRQKALKTGAVDAVAVDARNLFVDCFVWPALMAGAVYEGKYPLATALDRPLIAKMMVDAAHEHKARAVAHGCTGKAAPTASAASTTSKTAWSASSRASCTRHRPASSCTTPTANWRRCA